ncbi:hypothetical protein Kim5_PA00044 (plasmid) [Rhizobium sp. Kim5]|nr:hypothetical protein Kim5_PA00044 [Rhizobium sp. Kim5]
MTRVSRPFCSSPCVVATSSDPPSAARWSMPSSLLRRRAGSLTVQYQVLQGGGHGADRHRLALWFLNMVRRSKASCFPDSLSHAEFDLDIFEKSAGLFP